MGLLAFPAASILDSTSAGRALLTAADVAAQQSTLLTSVPNLITGTAGLKLTGPTLNSLSFDPDDGGASFGNAFASYANIVGPTKNTVFRLGFNPGGSIADKTEIADEWESYYNPAGTPLAERHISFRGNSDLLPTRRPLTILANITSGRVQSYGIEADQFYWKDCDNNYVAYWEPDTLEFGDGRFTIDFSAVGNTQLGTTDAEMTFNGTYINLLGYLTVQNSQITANRKIVVGEGGIRQSGALVPGFLAAASVGIRELFWNSATEELCFKDEGGTVRTITYT